MPASSVDEQAQHSRAIVVNAALTFLNVLGKENGHSKGYGIIPNSRKNSGPPMHLT